MTPEEQAQYLEFNTYWALKTADEYVWCYNEVMDWWKNADIPPAMEQAIVNARTAIAGRQPCGVDINKIMRAVQSRPRS